MALYIIPYAVLVCILSIPTSAFIADSSHVDTFETVSHFTAQGRHLFWRLHSIAASTGSFPHTDHTLKASGHGHVMLVTSSGIPIVGESTNLTSSMITLPAGKAVTVSFWIQGQGTHPYSIRLYIEDGTSAARVPIYTGTASSSQWSQVCMVTTAHNSRVSLRFEAVYRGAGSIPPMLAIDDLVVDAGTHCGATISCNFDHGLCGWTNQVGDTFNWLRHTGRTVSSLTGPNSDHTSTHGYYMYIETSSPRVVGDKARLRSPSFVADGHKRVVFWYHMYGATIGTLNVYLTVGQSLGSPVFQQSKASNNATTWKRACVDVGIHASHAYLVFEGIRGTSYSGDIAIDDVTLEAGSCSTVGQVDGQWGSWSSHGACSVTCGTGVRQYRRLCNNPLPSGGGHNCAGSSVKYLNCYNNYNDTRCAVNGGWSVWGTWTKCTTSCDMGVISRVRSCDHPAPYGGGKPCTGDSKETHDCSNGPCPQWSHWYDGTCSVTCGNGTQERVRQCSSGTNSQCSGNSYETVPCEGMYCL